MFGGVLEPKDFSNLQSAVERVKTSGSLNPLLWLCGIVTLPAFVLMIFSNGWPQIFYACISAVVIISALLAYGYLIVRDPDRVQSEEYQLDRYKISVLGDERHLGSVVDSKPVENIHRPQIESGENRERS